MNNINKLINEIKVYSIAGTEQDFNILPFITIYLYANDKLSIVNITNINNVMNDEAVIAYKDLEEAFFKDEISDSEKEDYNNGIDAYALTFNIDKNDYTDCLISFTKRSTLEFLQKRGTYTNVSKNIFKLFQALSTYSPETIKTELQYIFTQLIDYCFLYCTPLQDYYGIRNQKSCNDLNHLIMWLLNIGNNGKIQSIYHPMAEASLFISYIDAETLYQATYRDVRFLCLYQMFATILRKKVKLLPSENDNFNIDESKSNAVIFDNRRFGDYRFFWSIVSDICNSKKEGVVIADTNNLFEIKNERLTHVNWNILEDNISHIIYLPDNIALVKISNHKKNKDVILIDGTQDINYDKIINNIRNNKDIYLLTKEEIEAPDFVFGLNQILSKRERCLYKNDNNGIFVSGILMPSTTIKQKIDGSALNIYDANYSKHSPFYKVENGYIANTSEQEAKRLYSKYVLVINLVDRKKYQPKIVFYNKEFTISIDEYAYDINNDVVDYQYLINEMNKDYFIKQIYPTFNMDYSYVSWNELSECFIKIPDTFDSTTPLLRQRIIYNEEKNKHIQQLLTNLDYKFDYLSNNKNALPQGTLLKNGKYKIIRFLNSGGFGKAYIAINTITNEIVVIKEFFVEKIQRRDNESNRVVTPIIEDLGNLYKSRYKFMHEALKIREFKSCANIVKIYDIFDENDTCYFTMEYIKGVNLLEYVEDNGVLDEKEALDKIRSTANALKEMHKIRMNHFDIKPENIMIADDGRVVIIDFGAAHLHKDMKGENTYIPYRSNGYTAPYIPQYEDVHFFFSPTYDIYALGATLYFMLNGTAPFQKQDQEKCCILTDNLSLLNKRTENISKKTWECICKSLSSKKDDCQQSIDEFLEMLPS